MANFTPPKWGGETTSKDYEMLMAGTTPISEPVSLIGHSLTGLTPETQDAVTMPVVEKVRGRIVNRIKTLRAAQVTALTGTIGFGNALWTPALHKARLQGGCETTFYINRLCAADPDEAITFVMPEVVLAAPTRVNDPITVDETNLIEWQSEFRAPNEYILWAQGAFELTDLSDPMYAVAFTTEECADCDDNPYQNIVVAGGTNSVAVVRSTDRFATYSFLNTSAAPASHTARTVWTEGDVIVVGFSNNADYLSATTGGTLFSADGGASAMAVDTNLTHPVNGVTRWNGQYLAVGGAGGAQARVWTSTNGISWSAVTSAALPANAALAAVAVDEETGEFYTVGENGLVLKGRLSGSSVALTALTPTGVGTTDLYSVHVFGEDHIAIGGASGYYVESFDGGDTWTQPSFPGTNIVYAIAGNVHRALTASGTVFYVRDVQNKFVFTAATSKIRDGAAVGAAIRGIYSDPRDKYDGHNYMVAVTANGEVYLFRPLFPNA